MEFIKFGIFLLVLVLNHKSQAQFPSNIIERCVVHDNNCLKDAIQHVLKNYPTGVKQLGLRSIDPLKVEKLDINIGKNSPINMNLNFKNTELLGLSQSVIKSVTGFEKEIGSRIDIKGFTPTINLVGDYKISGSILLVPVVGSGPSNITLTNTDYTLKFLPKLTTKNGKTYVEIEKCKLKLNTKRVHHNFSNLFNGDVVLGENMNRIMNENWELIWSNNQPAVEESMSYIMKNVLNDVFATTSFDDLFSQ
uniref:CSON000204 protein n=1 Tax=Culicoides sonorensis TaxID=179676 RepID=A0A336MHV1_CULSO